MSAPLNERVEVSWSTDPTKPMWNMDYSSPAKGDSYIDSLNAGSYYYLKVNFPHRELSNYTPNTSETAKSSTEEETKRTDTKGKSDKKNKAVTAKTKADTKKREITMNPTKHYAVYTGSAVANDAAAANEEAYNVAQQATSGDLKNIGWGTDAWGKNELMNITKNKWTPNNAIKLDDNTDFADVTSAQNFLRSQGYNISADGWWGKQSQAAYEDYKKRKAIAALKREFATETPSLTTSRERSYTLNDKGEKVAKTNYNVTADQLKAAGITSYDKYIKYRNSIAEDLRATNPILSTFNRYAAHEGRNLETEDDFNTIFGIRGRWGKRDRNRIFDRIQQAQTNWDNKPDEQSEFGKLRDAFESIVKADSNLGRSYNANNIQWRMGDNNLYTAYYNDNGNYYKLGDDNKLKKIGYTRNNGEYVMEWRLGGSINKHQQGGTINMDEQQQLQQAFLQYLAQETGAKSEQELEQVIQQLGEDGLKQAYAQFMQAMQLQTVLAARFGAKLNYINRLNGKCPAGTQMQYYKVGGRLCKKCMQMEALGGSVKKQSGDAIDEFKLKQVVIRNRKKYGKKYDEDLLAGRKPVGKNKQGLLLYLNGDGEISAARCGAKIKKNAMGNVIKRSGQVSPKVASQVMAAKKSQGYLADRKGMNNFQKLLDFNRNHPYEDRSVDLTPAERATQDSLQNKAKKDGSWQRGIGRK